MDAFTTLTSRAAPLPQENVDTDIILPARFLLITEKRGLGQYAFYEWRSASEFVLDDPRWQGAQILVAGENFGCGSSREQAPWALHDLGLRCIIAPSFGEIFRGNCLRNGMLPIVLTGPAWQQAMTSTQAGDAMSIDLARQTVTLADGTLLAFTMPDAEREALLNGWDEIDGIIARYAGTITTFEDEQRRSSPWLWPKEPTHG